MWHPMIMLFVAWDVGHWLLHVEGKIVVGFGYRQFENVGGQCADRLFFTKTTVKIDQLRHAPVRKFHVDLMLRPAVWELMG